ncbi:MAG TPA: nucleotidyltransferase family protein [Paucimonas sp.]|nr:nucleotidyltransferase family protein [Paucimonas sp.]
MHSTHRRRITGILLAAGKGCRFDASGTQDKLLQRLPDGDMVAVASARRMRAALANVIAVVRPEAQELVGPLRELGCDVLPCAQAGQGMAASLVHALLAAQDGDGWVIGLADMPFVAPETISALVQTIDGGADIAAPVYQGRRGNPIAFSREHLARLLELEGDRGARDLLETFPVAQVSVNDPGILRDIDTREDLDAAART